MAQFHFEWWTVDLLLDTGRTTAEYKGRSKEHVIRQIKSEVKKSNSAENLSAPWFKRMNQIKEVYWDTLQIDRIGYQRLS